MEVEIDNQKHRVVYIEYRDNLPFEVNTIFYVDTSKKPYWRKVGWDFFPNNGDKKCIMAYEHCSGGSHKKIQAPKFADGNNVKYWLADDAKFSGKPKNIERIDKPIRVKGYLGNTSVNPFKIAEITHSREYCEVCDQESTEFCHEHKYDDKDGNVRYKHNDSYE